jgi:hypothetical protein
MSEVAVDLTLSFELNEAFEFCDRDVTVLGSR